MNVVHSCSDFGVAHEDEVASVTLGFLTQRTLTERHRVQTVALGSYVGPCEVTAAAPG